MLLQQFAHHGVMIQVPKHMLAYEQLQDYALFAAVRDTTTYGPCRKKNYDVASQSQKWNPTNEKSKFETNHRKG
jgi:hypothetical protein